MQGCLCCGIRVLGSDKGRINFISTVSAKESSFKRIAMLNAPEWPYCVVGILGSAGMGSVQPVYALILGKAINALYNPVISSMQSQVSMYAGIIAAIGAAALLFNILSFTSFGAMGHKLAMRVRLLILRSLLRQVGQVLFVCSTDDWSGCSLTHNINIVALKSPPPFFSFPLNTGSWLF